jgi:hypothetical protein
VPGRWTHSSAETFMPSTLLAVREQARSVLAPRGRLVLVGLASNGFALRVAHGSQ